MTNQELLQAVYARLGGKPDFAPEPLIIAKAQEAVKSVAKELVYSGHPMSSHFITSTEYEIPAYTELNTADEGSGFFIVDLENDEPIGPLGEGEEPVPKEKRVIKTTVDKLKTVYMKLTGEFVLDMGTFTISNDLLVDLGGFVNPAWTTIDFGTFNSLSITKNRKIIEPCNSWSGLETLPFIHNKSYYKYHGNKLYISLSVYDKVRKYYADEPEVGGTSVIEVEHYHYLPLSEFPYQLIDVLLTALLPMLMPQAPQPEPKKNEGKKKQ
jgi:hypothetical protein